MQTLPPNGLPINTIIATELFRIDAVDKSGYLAPVEINLLPRWRQAHGIATFSQMVEIAIDFGVTFSLPDGSDRFASGGYSLALHPLDLAALQDPERATFISMGGVVVEHPHRGGRA